MAQSKKALSKATKKPLVPTRSRRKRSESRLVESLGAEELHVDSSTSALGALAVGKRRQIVNGIRRYGESIEAEVSTLEGMSQTAVREALEEASSAARVAIADYAKSQAAPPAFRMRQMIDEVGQTVARLLAEMAERYEMSTAALKDQARVVLGTTRAVLSGQDMAIDKLITALDSEGWADQSELDQLNEARLLALHNRVRRESYASKELEKWGLQRQRLHQLRGESRLFAIKVPQERGLLYPHWQFDARTHREREIVPELIAAAQELEIDPLSFHLLMTNPDNADGETPLDLLETGESERVVAILRANAV